jgi:serine protease Do
VKPIVFAAILSAFIAAPAFSQTSTRPAPATAAAASTNSPQVPSINRAVQAVFPSLVRLSVVYLDQQAGREIKGQLYGSGTIISTDGYVVTNHHVAGRPRRIVCTMWDREEIPADLVGTDPLSDIAVVKLRPATPRKFPAARFGDSSKLERGQAVLAMGSPLALSQSVTQGIVSNPVMIMPSSYGGDGDRLDGEDVGTIVRWIGHDAAIYPGNSGGPLVAMNGEIVGINEISFGLGGAIPSNLARSVVESLIRDGRVKRSWTGIEVQPRIGSADKTGVLVAGVGDKSPGAAAGVEPGDILLKINDTAVDARYAEQLPEVNRVLLGLPVGQPSRLVLRRDGVDKTVTVTPFERPAAMSMPSEARAWGVTVANLTAFEAREMARDSTDGARVTSFRPNGPADQAKPALRMGDIIVEVDGHPVRSAADLEAQTNQLLADAPTAKALVGFERNRERYLTVVEIGTPRSYDPPRDAKKAWVPVRVQVLTPPLAEQLGLKGRTGVRVTRLLDEKTPLRVGDIILAIDGKVVPATALNDDELFGTTIRQYPVGASVNLTVNRDGKEQTVAITLGQTPSQPREMKSYEDPVFEFRARDVADVDLEDPRLKDAIGSVLVESVAVRGWAALGHLAGGDVILAIDGRKVQNVADLEARMKDIAARRPDSVVFEVKRGIRTLFIEFQPAWKQP